MLIIFTINRICLEQGIRRYHKGQYQYHAIVAALRKEGIFADRTLQRDIIRSSATMSKNQKYAYIKLTGNQQAIINESRFDLHFKNLERIEENEKPKS